MKIIWFSEIKWSYLRTRKQHILSNFDKDDEILFIEPLSFNLKNKFNISIEKNIKYITIPQIQNSDISFINYLINFLPFKIIIKSFATFLINRLLNKINFKPNVIITSNVFWIDYLIIIKNKLNLKIIYDCNDNPTAFPNSSNKKILFLKTLKHADQIIIPFKSYLNFIPKEYHTKIKTISNGVDSKLILSSRLKEINFLKSKDKNIVMFIGSIDTRLDYVLINQLSTELLNIKFIFIGDVKRQVKSKFDKIKSYNNVFHINSIHYNEMGKYLNRAKVCIIPFKKNNLSKYILPNKVFEYSAIGKPFILTDFNLELKDLNPDFLIAKNYKDFSNLILNQIENPLDSKKLQKFASKYEWSLISKQFKSMILSIIKK
tara:strand:- start:341 stop:1465 length:1125 start_codon:yes stop_codon:yes gene_type:complete